MTLTSHEGLGSFLASSRSPCAMAMFSIAIFSSTIFSYILPIFSCISLETCSIFSFDSCLDDEIRYEMLTPSNTTPVMVAPIALPSVSTTTSLFIETGNHMISGHEGSTVKLNLLSSLCKPLVVQPFKLLAPLWASCVATKRTRRIATKID